MEKIDVFVLLCRSTILLVRKCKGNGEIRLLVLWKNHAYILLEVRTQKHPHNQTTIINMCTNTCREDDGTNTVTRMYYDIDDVKEYALNSKTAEYWLRKRVKNCQDLVKKLEADLKEAKEDLLQCEQDLICQKKTIEFFMDHCAPGQLVIDHQV